MATLGFIPGIAALAVVTAADGGDGLQALADEALLQHQNRGGVLEAGHELAEVRERDARAPAARVVADHQAGLVVEREYALHGLLVEERGLVVVLADGGGGGADVDGVEQ